MKAQDTAKQTITEHDCQKHIGSSRVSNTLSFFTMGEVTLKLRSSEGDAFDVNPEVASMSTLIKNMVDDSTTDEEIPIPNVKSAILAKVLD